MDVNNVDNISSNVNLNPVPQQYIDKSRFNGSIDAVDNDDALKISILDIYNKRRDDLSISLQNLNEGIAITQISLNSLNKQQENLKNIGTSLIELQNSGDFDNNRIATANAISDELNAYNLEAQEARYNKRSLLDDQYGDQVINIVTEQKNFLLTGLNTKAISKELVDSLQTNTLSSNEEVSKAIESLKDAYSKSKTFSDDYEKVQTEIKQTARESINQQLNLYKENSKMKELNFGSDVDNFSKTNISSNLGYLAASQAHIIQEQTSKLLG